MAQNWYELTKLTGDHEFDVMRVQMRETGICIEGVFELPPLAKLSYEDQVFVAQFIRCHGSIKEMEQVFGVSYPTIKARLNKLNESLNLVQVEVPAQDTKEILKRLEQGEISAKEAAQLLKQ
jgi:hypothetical protein